jgi:Rieske Fe-S protein
MTDLADPTSRRAVLGGAVAVSATAVLAACGGGSDTASKSSGGSGSGSSGAGDGSIGTTEDIPVGGGTVFQKEKIVVTQPKKGEFKAFTAVCTHMGCTVGEVNGDTIQCNCHGSQYNAADGTVKRGPAPKALAEKKLKVEGDKLIVS